MKLLLYCTKSKPYLYRQDDDTFKLENKIVDEDISDYKKYYGLNNGKIVAECDFEVEEINTWKCPNIDGGYPIYNTKTLSHEKIREKSCLTNSQLEEYFGYDNGYAIYIKNLHTFDKPKELSDYDDVMAKPLNKAPQNMMYAYNEEDEKFKEYILISIQPQWLCKILNCEKTIEIRKKVLRGMLDD